MHTQSYKCRKTYLPEINDVKSNDGIKKLIHHTLGFKTIGRQTSKTTPGRYNKQPIPNIENATYVQYTAGLIHEFQD